MSNWNKVADFFDTHGSSILKVGAAVLTGGPVAGVAAVADVITDATGQSNPAAALSILKNNPEVLAQVEVALVNKEVELRRFESEMYKAKLMDRQAEHVTQSNLIAKGDSSNDPVVRRTRPLGAILSLLLGFIYTIQTETPDALIVAAFMSPFLAYMGFRTADKWSHNKHGAGSSAVAVSAIKQLINR